MRTHGRCSHSQLQRVRFDQARSLVLTPIYENSENENTLFTRSDFFAHHVQQHVGPSANNHENPRLLGSQASACRLSMVVACLATSLVLPSASALLRSNSSSAPIHAAVMSFNGGVLPGFRRHSQTRCTTSSWQLSVPSINATNTIMQLP